MPIAPLPLYAPGDDTGSSLVRVHAFLNAMHKNTLFTSQRAKIHISLDISPAPYAKTLCTRQDCDRSATNLSPVLTCNLVAVR